MEHLRRSAGRATRWKSAGTGGFCGALLVCLVGLQAGYDYLAAACGLSHALPAQGNKMRVDHSVGPLSLLLRISLSLRAEMLFIEGYRPLNEFNSAEADKGMRFVGIAETFDRLSKRGQSATEVI